MEWHEQGDEAWAQLADARLIVLKNLLVMEPDGVCRCRYGWRWVVVPMKHGHLDIHHPIQDTDVRSEPEPYPTQAAAMSAVERYYVREWHAV